MTGQYTFSLDRELWTGSFETREQALAEALKRAAADPNAPLSVYVGQIAAVDPRVSGHAQAILNSIARRVRSELGEAAENMLADVSREQVCELDAAIAQAVVAWLGKHNLTHRFNRIEAISEHPVPSTPQVSAGPGGGREVQEIGVGELPPEQ